MRDAFFVPQSRDINDLLNEMRDNKIHMGIVVDEYGQTAGIVSMEDILEEIVGNILDEYDEEEIIEQRHKENEYRYHKNDNSIPREFSEHKLDSVLQVEEKGKYTNDTRRAQKFDNYVVIHNIEHVVAFHIRNVASYRKAYAEYRCREEVAKTAEPNVGSLVEYISEGYGIVRTEVKAQRFYYLLEYCHRVSRKDKHGGDANKPQGKERQRKNSVVYLVLVFKATNY
jgi:hypothetical protein